MKSNYASSLEELQKNYTLINTEQTIKHKACLEQADIRYQQLLQQKQKENEESLK